MYKLEAENIVRKKSDSLIIRMGGFFGGEVRDKNFIGKIFSEFKNAMRSGDQVIQVGARKWQPTYTKDLAMNSLVLMALEKNGTYNMASHGQASFFEVATAMAQILNLSDKLRIVPSSNEEHLSHELELRPRSANLQNLKLTQEGIDFQRPWRESLSEYLNSDFFME
jgi:dTDP-4-dehydrorhamnose reductase